MQEILILTILLLLVLNNYLYGMRTFVRNIETTELDGGWLCLDFINTVRNRYEKPVKEYMNGPEDWLLWCRRLGLIDEKGFDDLMSLIRRDKKPASNQLKNIITFREEIYRIFLAIAEGVKPPQKSIDFLNRNISFCFKHLTLDIKKKRETNLHFEFNNTQLLYPLLPVIKSAYDLLQSDLLDRIKECSNCGWLFLDKSKNNSRRWCSMQTCGSSDKSKRYYRKTKKLEVKK